MNAPLKPFEEMTAEDYAALGLRAGLEIHQQLLTQKKLFCRCPAGMYSEKHDAEILRHMRPTLSELGEYDGTALMEFKTRKEIIYRINHETVCTYEMDDTPPFEINPEALDIAVQIAMLFNYQLVSEIHIARKQYLDGSIPTGFQRTTIVGVNGWIPFRDGRIGLVQLGLEEDSCREISDVGHQRVYRTDRLGMPLFEVVTEPQMRTPQEVAEVANQIRWTVRATGKVRTGIGAARQDVNVSIRGGTRIEIKGVPRIPLIPLLIHNEAQRQHSLLQIRDELHRRGITEESLRYQNAEVTSLLQRASYEPIRQALSRNEQVHCVCLRGFLGILSHPTQTGKVFSKEISDRVRVIACLTRLPNILTSESTEETIDSFTWSKIRKLVKAGPQDSLILVWGDEQDCQTAIREIVIRAKEAAVGVPNETRQALPDGTNGFERILPGADRMYPDTDLPPLEITEARIKRLRRDLPPPLWERERRYREMGVPAHLVIPLALSPQATLFEMLAESGTIPITWLVRFLYERLREWQRKNLPVERFTLPVWQRFFKLAAQQPALIEAGEEILQAFLADEQANLDDLATAYLPPRITAEQLPEIIRNALSEARTDFPTPAHHLRYAMGRVMAICRGQIKAEQVKNAVSSYLKREGAAHE